MEPISNHLHLHKSDILNVRYPNLFFQKNVNLCEESNGTHNSGNQPLHAHTDKVCIDETNGCHEIEIRVERWPKCIVGKWLFIDSLDLGITFDIFGEFPLGIYRIGLGNSDTLGIYSCYLKLIQGSSISVV
jgi:hypothetical protein